MQAQFQALAERKVGGVGVAVVISTEVARLQVFDRTLSKVSGFVTACRLYIRMKMRRITVEEQILWILSYIQGGSADVWKENTLKDLEAGLLEYETAGEFLAEIRKEFGEEDKKLVKVAELRRLEQEGKMMEEFVQEFRRVARGSRYEGRLLVEEFKRGMSGAIRRKLMEAEKPPTSIEQ